MAPVEGVVVASSCRAQMRRPWQTKTSAVFLLEYTKRVVGDPNRPIALRMR